jgi:prephenate dehydratase
MARSIAYLGPSGTNAEAAALICAQWLLETTQEESLLCPYPSITQTLRATATGETDLVVVPVENSIEGSVSVTLDTLWQLDTLRIQKALVLPISYAFLSYGSVEQIQTVYSHPQALAQCQSWLERALPNVQLIPTNSTTEALRYLERDPSSGAISSQRAAQLYSLPVLAYPIGDHPDNCTRFWILSLQPSPGGSHTSLALSFSANLPGALVRPLQSFAERGINLSRIESRPTKRSLGEYLFFIDIEADVKDPATQSALKELDSYAETLKIFGSYTILPA